MATDDSFTTRVRPAVSQRSNILAMLDDEVLVKSPEPADAASPAVPSAFGEMTLLPQPGDPYVAHARPSNGAETTLYCIDREGYFEGFAWNTFDRLRLVKPERPSGGPVLVLRFYGSEVTEVAIEGRNLDALQVFLGQCRLVWLRELGEGKAFGLGPNDAAITKLTIQSVER